MAGADPAIVTTVEVSPSEIASTGDVQFHGALKGFRVSYVEEPPCDPGHIPLSYLTRALNINDSRINDVFVLSDDDDDDQEVEEPTFSLASIDKGGFAISCLVWAKMEGMGWWPSLLIDPSDAPHVTIENQDPEKEMHLVAYFDSEKIKWLAKSQIRPFFKYFPMFKNMSRFEQFEKAIEFVLKEVSRRFVLGTICPCIEDKSLSKVTDKSAENLGINENFTNYTINRGEFVNFFNPKDLVGFITDLALVPFKESCGKIESAIAYSQIVTFREFHRIKDPPNPATNEVVNKKTRKRKANTPLKFSKPTNQINEPTIDENNSISHKKQKLTLETNEASPSIVPVEERRSDERGPAALSLQFCNKKGQVPNKRDLKRILSRYGALKRGIEKKTEGNLIKFKIDFKNRADADVAFAILRKDNLIEQTPVVSRIRKLSEMEKKSCVQNGEDLPDQFKRALNVEDWSFKILEHFNLQPHKPETPSSGKISSDPINTIVDLGDIVINPNPKLASPNPNLESRLQCEHTFANPNLAIAMQPDDTLANPNPNPEITMQFDLTSDNPNPEATMQFDQTSANPNPNPETTMQFDQRNDFNDNNEEEEEETRALKKQKVDPNSIDPNNEGNNDHNNNDDDNANNNDNNNNNNNEGNFFANKKFKTREELVQAIRSYCAIQGNTIKMATSRADKYVIICCSKSGTYRNSRNIQPEDRKRKRKSELTGCPFKIRCKKQDGFWKGEILNSTHVHNISGQSIEEQEVDLTFLLEKKFENREELIAKVRSYGDVKIVSSRAKHAYLKCSKTKFCPFTIYCKLIDDGFWIIKMRHSIHKHELDSGPV